MNFLRLFIRDGRQRRRLAASISIRRSGPARGRRKRSGASLDLEPFFAYALTVRAPHDGPLAESGRSGVIIANSAGRPVHLSAEAPAAPLSGRLSEGRAWDQGQPGAGLPAPVVRICRNLSRASSGDADASAPVYHHRNVWGGFRFRAEWLDGNDPASGLIAITVTHQEPLPIALDAQCRAPAAKPPTGRSLRVDGDRVLPREDRRATRHQQAHRERTRPLDLQQARRAQSHRTRE